MELAVHELHGQQFLEGPSGQPLLRKVEDITLVIGDCFSYKVERLLLYAENLTEQFFNLSSGEAGEILQKLRNYHIRLAIVAPPTLQMSHRFGELLADERQGPYLRLFEARAPAEEWLCPDAQSATAAAA